MLQQAFQNKDASTMAKRIVTDTECNDNGNRLKAFCRTLIPKTFGATNFRTKKCPKVCNAENINFFALSESL